MQVSGNFATLAPYRLVPEGQSRNRQRIDGRPFEVGWRSRIVIAKDPDPLAP
jgi:hypothetical protein